MSSLSAIRPGFDSDDSELAAEERPGEAHNPLEDLRVCARRVVLFAVLSAQQLRGDKSFEALRHRRDIAAACAIRE